MISAPVRKASSLRWLSNFVSSTVGAKYLVAITGLLLTGFVLLHMLGNLQVFRGRDAMNSYAQSLKGLGPLLWLGRGLLLLFFLVHLFLALRLKKRSLDARPVAYQHHRFIEASWVSRHMALTGFVILGFVIFHLMHFTFGWIDRVEDPTTGTTIGYLQLKDPLYADPAHPGQTRADVYHMFISGFRNVPISLVYIICQLLLGMHLLHGTYSMFQTLGWNSVRFDSLIGWFAYALTTAIVAANVFMPIAVMARVVGNDIP
jgi:succinate dehydrogenase / fumarate reductase cytochrome b subunit